MKGLIFRFLVTAFAVMVTTSYVPGIKYAGGWQTLFLVTLVLFVINLFIKPILLLFTLPVEVVTLGLFGIIINALMLLLVAKIVPQFTIEDFLFSGLSFGGIVIAPTAVPVLGTAIIGSILINLIAGLLRWLAK